MRRFANGAGVAHDGAPTPAVSDCGAENHARSTRATEMRGQRQLANLLARIARGVES